MEELRRDVGELRDRVSRTETKLDAHSANCVDNFHALHRRIDNEVASRLWVRDELQSAIKPVAEIINRQAAQIAEIVQLQKGADKRLEEFHATQNEAMSKRVENEKRESDARVMALESSSFRNVVRRWWFWALAACAAFPAVSNAIDAVQHLTVLLHK